MPAPQGAALLACRTFAHLDFLAVLLFSLLQLDLQLLPLLLKLPHSLLQLQEDGHVHGRLLQANLLHLLESILRVSDLRCGDGGVIGVSKVSMSRCREVRNWWPTVFLCSLLATFSWGLAERMLIFEDEPFPEVVEAGTESLSP